MKGDSRVGLGFGLGLGVVSVLGVLFWCWSSLVVLLFVVVYRHGGERRGREEGERRVRRRHVLRFVCICCVIRLFFD